VWIRRLPTHFGVLSFGARVEGADRLRFHLTGDIDLPRGGIVLRPPVPQPLKAVKVNGNPVDSFSADSATVHEFPADVVLEY